MATRNGEDAAVQKWRITFGQKYRHEPHPVLGMVPTLPDQFVTVEAVTEKEARWKAIDWLGTAWSFHYPSVGPEDVLLADEYVPLGEYVPRCETCQGSGGDPRSIQTDDPNSEFYGQPTSPCERCGGSGRSPHQGRCTYEGCDEPRPHYHREDLDWGEHLVFTDSHASGRPSGGTDGD